MKHFIYKSCKKIIGKGRDLKEALQEITGKGECSHESSPKFSRVKFAVSSIIGIFSYSQPVYASGAITTKINSLYDLVVGIIGAAGAIILAWGVFEFATAYQHHDSSQQTQALKKVVAGILCCSAGVIIGLLK